MVIIFSYNKTGYESDCWRQAIEQAGDEQFRFIPFNHDPYLDPLLYDDSVKLDRLYQNKHPALRRLYDDFNGLLKSSAADAVIVHNIPPYHPDFLQKLTTYKVLFSSDDPGATYMRTIPYLHAYDHVMYVNPAYSADMDMASKMQYAGMRKQDWRPYGLLPGDYDPNQTEDSILAHDRDIDIIYVGAPYRQKLERLARLKKEFKHNCALYGRFPWKWNAYFSLKHRVAARIKAVSFPERVKLHQRAKIGFNIHWNDYGLGNQRLYYLPANGVMQLCDCADYVSQVFEIGKEIVTYDTTEDLIDKIHYYLAHDDERESIALNGYRRVMKDYHFSDILRESGCLIAEAMARDGRHCQTTFPRRVASPCIL